MSPTYQVKDRFYHKAKESGFRSRASFKIIEINKKFRLLRRGMDVIDLGCAPGGWTQIIAKEIGLDGKVLGVDLEPLPPFGEKNVHFIQGDVREEATHQKILTELGRKVDLIVSDMAPHTTGVKFQDQYHSYELAHLAFQMCRHFLKSGGSFVTKIFPGEELEGFKKELRGAFSELKTYIPESTRKTSTEIYLIAKGFNGSV